MSGFFIYGDFMIIRKYKKSDSEKLFKLFYDTIYFINSEDYTEKQLKVWAKESRDLSLWEKYLSENYTLVAEEKNTIIGFGNINKEGYLDMLYVHKDFQRKNIASQLCDKLENIFPVLKVTVHASITAKPFFEKRGYKVICEQFVEREKIFLKNYIMKKDL